MSLFRSLLPAVVILLTIMQEVTAGLRRSLQDDDFSFRFEMFWSEEYFWESPFTWCVECESGGESSSSCNENDRLIIDKCGSSSRQRFVLGDGLQISPQGSPELCLTRDDDVILLEICSEADPSQKWYGLDEENEFELYQGQSGDSDDYCFSLDSFLPRKNAEISAVECESARKFETGKWDLGDVKGVMSDRVETTYSPTFSPTEAPTTFEACIDLWKGDDLMKSNIMPITTSDDIEDFYGYDDGDNYSFNGDDVVELVPDHSLVFIHEHEESGDLSLVIVHDSKEEATGGKVRMIISGNLENSVVQDGRDSPSDEYKYKSSRDETDCFWEWSWQGGSKKYRTDGIADYWNPNRRECLYIDVKLMKGIDKWQFVPGPADDVDPDEYITLDEDKRLWICKCGVGMEER